MKAILIKTLFIVNYAFSNDKIQDYISPNTATTKIKLKEMSQKLIIVDDASSNDKIQDYILVQLV